VTTCTGNTAPFSSVSRKKLSSYGLVEDDYRINLT